MSEERPSLPYEWVVKQSGIFRNTPSGVSTLEVPKLVKTGTNQPKFTGKENIAKSPCAMLAHKNDSGSSYSDCEKMNTKNSQFQKEIFDDVIKNSPWQYQDDIETTPTETRSPVKKSIKLSVQREHKQPTKTCNSAKEMTSSREHGQPFKKIRSSVNKMIKSSKKEEHRMVLDSVDKKSVVGGDSPKYLGMSKDIPEVKATVEKDCKKITPVLVEDEKSETYLGISDVLPRIKQDVKVDCKLQKRLTRDLKKENIKFKLVNSNEMTHVSVSARKDERLTKEQKNVAILEQDRVHNLN